MSERGAEGGQPDEQGRAQEATTGAQVDAGGASSSGAAPPVELGDARPTTGARATAPAWRRAGGAILRELRFLGAIWKAGLLSAMEYRAAFLTQVVGMALNNLIYLGFWAIFFARFDTVRGWGLAEVVLLFAVVATGFGVAVWAFGNTLQLAEIIAEGRLDHYLSTPRPVLLHAISGNSRFSGLGDVASGIMIYLVLGDPSVLGGLRFVVGSLAAATVLLGFLITVQSLAFWAGGAAMLSGQAFNAIVTFATYPLVLFDGTAKLVLLTIIPAAFVGAVPAEFVRGFDLGTLLQLLAAATVATVIALTVFHRGLRRYESGSAIVNVS